MSQTVTGAANGTKIVHRTPVDHSQPDENQGELSEHLVAPGETFAIPDDWRLVRVFDLSGTTWTPRLEDERGGPSDPA